MIIKSHIRGGYRAAADYLKSQGLNEQIRLVEISDPDARNLDEAFHNMWTLAANSKVKKPLHHISINPMKGERLTDGQVKKIIERAEQKYGYKPNDHQRVIVEHVKDGRQHFHVIWNRVSLTTGKAVWPGQHWKKSKQVCREMEQELGLKRPTSKRMKNVLAAVTNGNSPNKRAGWYWTIEPNQPKGNISFLVLPQIRQRFSIKSCAHDTAKNQADLTSMTMMPRRPTARGSMCEEQQIDYSAACEGRITWQQYFKKWGGNGLSL